MSGVNTNDNSKCCTRETCNVQKFASGRKERCLSNFSIVDSTPKTCFTCQNGTVTHKGGIDVKGLVSTGSGGILNTTDLTITKDAPSTFAVLIEDDSTSTTTIDVLSGSRIEGYVVLVSGTGSIVIRNAHPGPIFSTIIQGGTQSFFVGSNITINGNNASLGDFFYLTSIGTSLTFRGFSKNNGTFIIV